MNLLTRAAGASRTPARTSGGRCQASRGRNRNWTLVGESSSDGSLPLRFSSGWASLRYGTCLKAPRPEGRSSRSRPYKLRLRSNPLFQPCRRRPRPSPSRRASLLLNLSGQWKAFSPPALMPLGPSGTPVPRSSGHARADLRPFQRQRPFRASPHKVAEVRRPRPGERPLRDQRCGQLGRGSA